MQVVNRPLKKEDAAPAVVGYDVRVPLSPADPWWYGMTELSIDAPSVGVWGQYLGHVELTGFPRGQFKRVEFAIPAALQQKLNNNYTDLTFRIVVSVSANETASYLIDRFTFGPGSSCVPVPDGNPCTDDVCTKGNPAWPNRPVGAPCDTNATVCDGTGTCSGAGQCNVTDPPILEDGNPCTTDACDPVLGVTHLPVTAGVSCETDADACNGISRCNGTGTCVAGPAPAIDDNNPCTDDSCAAATGVEHAPRTAGANCDTDNDVCNGSATCDQNATCVTSPAPTIDDQNECTIDTCDPQRGVLHVAASNNSPCDDGNACTLSDHCQNAVCVPGNPRSCAASDQCHLAGVCDPSSGACSNPSKPDNTTCDDGNACTRSDACNNGACIGASPVVCSAASVCQNPGVCDPSSGACSVTTSPDGTACDDETVCNGHEVCAAGACTASSAPSVDDSNPCTVDSCDPLLGVRHVATAAGVACDDANACNGHEICDGSGSCTSGSAPALTDGNPCTEDTCDALTGVRHTPLPTGTSCTDADVCNGEERCDATGTCQEGMELAVDDGDPCTQDECDPAAGGVHTPIPNCHPNTSGPGQPFETRASILGRVIRKDGSGVGAFTLSVFNEVLTAPPREDVLVSASEDGSFRARLTEFAETTTDDTPPAHVLVRIEGPDFATITRSVYLRPGDAAPLGNIVVLSRDSAVTVIGPLGGTARDSHDTFELVVPAGALAAATPIVITPIASREEFPTPLPNTTLTTYGVELEPSGTQFAIPAQLRIKNTLNLPTGLKIPVGTVDTKYGDWQHEGFAVWDGTRFSTTIAHFSTHDCNGAWLGELLAFADDGADPHKASDTKCVGSAVGVSNGALKQSFEIPGYSAAGANYSVAFSYDASLSGSLSLGAGVPPPMGSGRSLQVSFAPPKVRFQCVPRGSGGANGSCGGAGGPSCTVGGVEFPIGLSRKLTPFGKEIDAKQRQNGSEPGSRKAALGRVTLFRSLQRRRSN